MGRMDLLKGMTMATAAALATGAAAESGTSAKEQTSTGKGGCEARRPDLTCPQS